MVGKLKSGCRLLDLSEPAVMAIVNVTPDSFYAGSRTPEEEAVRDRIRRAVEEGASIIDVGGYSSRPGAADVPPQEELRRVSLAVGAVRDEFPDMPVSLDTFRATVAAGVMERYGVCIVNDISGGTLDKDMLATVAAYGAPFIAMHMRGTPADMQRHCGYSDIVKEVYECLAERLEAANHAGIRDVILDPGFGFAKTTEQNYELLAGMRILGELGCPILAGVSRKSMIYRVLGTAPEESLNGTTALNWECLRQGAAILRVHDVAPAVEVVKLFKFYGEHGEL